VSSADGPIEALALLRFRPDGLVIGHEPADPRVPQLSVLDLAATRGDGVFETISIGRGVPQALEAHLARLAHSAAVLDLPSAAAAEGPWRAAVLAVAEALGAAAGLPEEGFVKIVLSRGVEGADTPTGWAYGTASPDHSALRRDGVRVVLLDRGYRHDVAHTSPWLLAGAKTLSYAINRSAFREAARRGADDVVWVSSDGYLLEGPVSSLVILRGGRLFTPSTDLGILAGTTQADLFAWAATERGLHGAFEPLTPSDLAAADAAWLVSSVRHAVPIRAVDGREHAIDAELTGAMNAFLRDRTR